MRRATTMASRRLAIAAPKWGTPLLRSTANLLIMGPPGSGKGTYGNLLANELNADLITAGDILRDEVSRGTKMGLAIKECQAMGRLADDHLVSEAVRCYLVEKYGERNSSQSGETNEVQAPQEKESGGRVRFILDGFPRTVAQAKIIKSKLWPSHLRADVAVSIDVPDQICIDKALGRRFCKECRGNFNVTGINDGRYFMPPNLPDPPCDCNKQNNWTKREDDKEDIISSRIATFYRETAPIIGHYEALGKMLHFTPHRGVEDVNKLTKMVLTYFGWCEDM